MRHFRFTLLIAISVSACVAFRRGGRDIGPTREREVESTAAAGAAAAISPTSRAETEIAPTSATDSASSELPEAAPFNRDINLRGVFIAIHLEQSDNPQNVQKLWPRLLRFVGLADSFGVKYTLMFTPQWAQWVLDNTEQETVFEWEEYGHEIALHHHGSAHGFWDGYTNDPERINPQGYPNGAIYLGSMDDLMSLINQLSQQTIVSAGMTDEQTDWVSQLLYHASKADGTESGAKPTKEDLLSIPSSVSLNGHPATLVSNTGYAIDRLEAGGQSVELWEIENALETATLDQVMGIVINDQTLTTRVDDMEALFDHLEFELVNVQTLREILSGTPNESLEE